MKKILILYPHFPPSNLAGVHRPRLFAQHLPSFGWEPVILTVHEKYYEETADWNLVKLLPENLRIEKVAALPITKPRIAGDIGIRALFQLYLKAKELINSEGFDFLFIPIPSFYSALLGRWLYNSTGIKYGIDYIDPWVHPFPGSEKKFTRGWFSLKIAEWLEPIAVKNASLITGVASGYFEAVLDRNPILKTKAITGAMPYGGEAEDHLKLDGMNLQPYLFAKSGKIDFVYAGAMLPKAYTCLEAIFRSIASHIEEFADCVFHFIGTGKTADDPEGYNIKPIAEKYGLWQKVIYEYPKRIPYLDVLVHLNSADAIFILGSTEPHYTPSKTYQGVLSGKPLLAVLHSQSTAVKVIRESQAGMVLDFDGEKGVGKIEETFPGFYRSFKFFRENYNKNNIDQKIFDAYSAKNVTGQLAELLNRAIEQT